jgi:hypothetical protein
MKPNLRFALSAALAAVVFGIGYYVFIFFPGAGDTPDSDFTTFYASDNKMNTAMILSGILLVGSLAMLWFYNELRARLPGGMLVSVGYAAGMVGVVAAPLGAFAMGGPAGAYQQTTHADLIGSGVAMAFAQMGLGITLFLGMTSFAVSAILLSLAARRSGLLPSWLGIVGIILGVATLGSFFWAPGYAFLIWVFMTGVVVGMRGEAAG